MLAIVCTSVEIKPVCSSLELLDWDGISTMVDPETARSSQPVVQAPAHAPVAGPGHAAPGEARGAPRHPPHRVRAAYLAPQGKDVSSARCLELKIAIRVVRGVCNQARLSMAEGGLFGICWAS